MEATANNLMLEAADTALVKAAAAQTVTERITRVRSAGFCLRAGLQEAITLNDAMEGLGASQVAREKSFEMVLDGEI